MGRPVFDYQLQEGETLWDTAGPSVKVVGPHHCLGCPVGLFSFPTTKRPLISTLLHTPFTSAPSPPRPLPTSHLCAPERSTCPSSSSPLKQPFSRTPSLTSRTSSNPSRHAHTAPALHGQGDSCTLVSPRFESC